MGCISRDAVLAATDLPRERVDVPEWGAGAYVFVRGMTGTEKDSWEKHVIERRASLGCENVFPGIRASVVVRCAVDDDGGRIFTDADVELVGAKNGKAIDRIFDKASRLSGITPEDIEELKKP